MAVVYIPAMLREHTGGLASFVLPGERVGDLLDQLEERFPGLRARLLRPNVVIAVDGEIAQFGEAERVGPETEVHFVAAITGGRDKLKLTIRFTPD